MTNQKIIISPSILSADFADLKTDIKKVEPYVDWLHIDVMDGHFVPNISIGVPVVKSIRKVTNLFLDTHLMIENPIKYIDAFAEAGSDLITFHYEAAKEDTIKTIEKIKANNKKVGISIKPKTPAQDIKEYINMVDLVLIMTVEPGFGGQKFIGECIEKVSLIKEYSKNPNLIIQVDGGVNDITSKTCIKAGVNSLVAGSYVYKAENIKTAIEKLV